MAFTLSSLYIARLVQLRHSCISHFYAYELARIRAVDVCMLGKVY